MGREATVPIIVTIVDERNLNGDIIAVIDCQVATCYTGAVHAGKGEFTGSTNPYVEGNQTLNRSVEGGEVGAGITSNITAEDGLND